MKTTGRVRRACYAVGLAGFLATVVEPALHDGRAWADHPTAARDPEASTLPASPMTTDTRAPVPLTRMMAEHQKQNMREHLAAVQEIVAGLAADDLKAVGVAARKIGYSDAMEQMCRHMGAGAAGFTEMALAFHHRADTIAEAADKGDAKEVLRALSATVQACVGCHATYRQQIVNE